MENNYLSGAPKDLEDRIAIDRAGFSRATGVPAAARARASLAPAPPAVTGSGRDGECSWTRSGC
jgi:hypothetical protein